MKQKTWCSLILLFIYFVLQLHGWVLLMNMIWMMSFYAVFWSQSHNNNRKQPVNCISTKKTNWPFEIALKLKFTDWPFHCFWTDLIRGKTVTTFRMLNGTPFDQGQNCHKFKSSMMYHLTRGKTVHFKQTNEFISKSNGNKKHIKNKNHFNFKKKTFNLSRGKIVINRKSLKT